MPHHSTSNSDLTAIEEGLRDQPERSSDRRGEQIESLRELAAIAAADKTQKSLQHAGFIKEGEHFREENDRIASVIQLAAGNVTVSTSVEFPRGMLESMAVSAEPVMLALHRNYERAKLDSDLGAPRFPCGRIFYTLKQRWTPGRIEEMRRWLSIPQTETVQRIESQLHFRFQQLYLKAPDDWTSSEATEWQHLLTYIDFDAYQKDNPPTDNRIGRILGRDADRITIRWSTGGEMSYPSRSVPPDLLVAPEGWLVHAEFHCGSGTEVWLSTRVAPPLPSDAETITADIAEARISPPAKLADADWPKIGV